MYNYYLKPFLLVLALVSLISFAVVFVMKTEASKPPVKVEEIGKTNAVTLKGIEVTRLTDEVDHGLNLVRVNDTLNLLIYRGVESVSMIQIK